MISQIFKKLNPFNAKQNGKKTTKNIQKMKLAWLFILTLALILSSMPLDLLAQSGGDTPTYIAFTSDVHENTGNLETWIGNLGVPTLDRMIFGGDYSGQPRHRIVSTL